MIKKELSITELFGVLSVIALSISMLSNTYFYYSLDALWVMSILSPSFYISEIIKVVVIMAVMITVVGFLMDIYHRLIKIMNRVHPNKRYRLVSGEDNQIAVDAIKKSARKFQTGQSYFVTLFSAVFITVLAGLKVITFASLFWVSILIGTILGSFTNTEVKRDNTLKFFIFAILVILTACFSAHLKLNSLHKLPIAILKNQQVEKETQIWNVLDATQDKMILLNRNENNKIKIVKFDEINQIISNHK
ncbi:hypothetical protein [Acinetobacter silvestris]|uniref:Uncharacterized protein n=1 Tax=Acinetobacter silvestris TaxID=1977882 RepID=A0A1Y3CDM5_9GAMM|nr:hypothetical protein [Acinetobacter silvestris]OTG65179.1 hypothetical protein B9T28_10370 [Acinetobacter silvestris]